MQELKYIENKQENGLEYDFKTINKIYMSLKCPKEYYNPCTLPFDKAKYFTLLSIRATGKTTNILLWCMCARKWYIDTYGPETQAPSLGYVRQTLDMIMPKNIRDMFSVIIQNNYVEKLTDGKFNSIIYKNRAFYYVFIDEKGDIVNTDKEYLCFCFALNKRMEYKSTFNNPKLDFIIFDEFISDRYTPNEFIDFMDLLATIFRERLSPIIFLLANNIDKHSPYFRELSLIDSIQYMNFGDNKIVKTSTNTYVYVELIGLAEEKKKTKKRFTDIFFGFNNPKLSMITGNLTWAVSNYQHIPRDLDDYETTEIIGNRYISYNFSFVRLRYVHNEKYGIMVLVTPATKTHDDSIIYTVDDIQHKNYRFALGYSKIDKLFYNALKRNQFYYAMNDCGNIVSNFMKESIKKTL